MEKKPMATLLFLFYIFTAVPTTLVSSSPAPTFTPKDNFLVDCGSGAQTTHFNGKLFLSDQNSGQNFSSKGRDILASIPSANVSSPIYLSARIFIAEATYTFQMAQPGWHWIRLHFFPFKTNEFNLQDAKFMVTTDNLVLIHDFQVENNTANLWFFKEYLVNVTSELLSVKFTPVKGGPAFINAIEVVSAPDVLITDSVSALFPIAQIDGFSTQSYQTVYRLNVGGPELTSQNDTLGRTWATDGNFLTHKELGKEVSVSPTVIKYPELGSPLIAPQLVYASAVEMGNANVAPPNFNVTWNLDIDLSFQYVVRLHFCDIISQSLEDLYFNVFINGKMAISGIDLSTLTGGLATAYYKDFVVNSSMVSSPLAFRLVHGQRGRER